MNKVLIFLSKGFDDLEAATFIEVLGWTTIRDNTKPIELKTCAFHDEVTGRFGIKIKVDFNISKDEIDFSDFDAFVLPGGFHSYGFDEAYSEVLHKIAKEFHQQNKPIATLCVGVLPVSDAGQSTQATKLNLIITSSVAPVPLLRLMLHLNWLNCLQEKKI